jgi:hypothetical protein
LVSNLYLSLFIYGLIPVCQLTTWMENCPSLTDNHALWLWFVCRFMTSC